MHYNKKFLLLKETSSSIHMEDQRKMQVIGNEKKSVWASCYEGYITCMRFNDLSKPYVYKDMKLTTISIYDVHLDYTKVLFKLGRNRRESLY